MNGLKRLLPLLLLIPLILTSCGRVRTAKEIYKTAKRSYGACTIVSKSESGERTEVVLHDELQDFDYRVTSRMTDINIDNTSFGSIPQTSDNFLLSLQEKVRGNVRDVLDSACSEYGCTYSSDTYIEEYILIIFAPDAEKGKACALKCAEALQGQNMKQRLDGNIILAVGNESPKYIDNEHYGSVKLPDIVFRTPEDEDIDYYTRMAHMQTDPEARFLRTEKKTFRDTGAELDRVAEAVGFDDPFPTEMSSPVTFYYFRSSKGNEYFLCDFNYYDEDHREMAWYTNYTE